MSTTSPSTTLPPPQLPLGYQARGVPRPLLSPQDERYIVIASSQGMEGYLIFEENRTICFFTKEEMSAVLAYLGDRFALMLLTGESTPSMPCRTLIV